MSTSVNPDPGFVFCSKSSSHQLRNRSSKLTLRPRSLSALFSTNTDVEIFASMTEAGSFPQGSRKDPSSGRAKCLTSSHLDKRKAQANILPLSIESALFLASLSSSTRRSNSERTDPCIISSWPTLISAILIAEVASSERAASIFRFLASGCSLLCFPRLSRIACSRAAIPEN